MTFITFENLDKKCFKNRKHLVSVSSLAGWQKQQMNAKILKEWFVVL